MFNLIHSDLSRLFRLASFRIFMAVTLLLDIFLEITEYDSDIINNGEHDVYGSLQFLCIGLLIEGAVIIGNLIGSDHTDHTIRNKIIAGYTKTEVFFSYYVICFICMLILTVWSYAVILISGFALGGIYTPDAGTTVKFIGMTLLFILVCAAFFTALYLNVFTQTVSMMLGVLIAGSVVIMTSGVVTELTVSKYIDDDAADTMISYGITLEHDPDDPEKFLNPGYTEGGSPFVRLTDVLSPVSHILYPHEERQNANLLAVSAEIIVFTAAGYIIFRKRDLK